MKLIWKFLLFIFIILVLFFLAGFSFLFQFITDYLWLEETGYSIVFTRQLFIQFLSFMIPFLFSLFCLLFWFAIIRRVKRKFIYIFIFLTSMAAGFLSLLKWKIWVIHPSVSSGIYRDPFFGIDAYFFIALLPFLKLLIFITAIIFSFILVVELVFYSGGDKGFFRDGKIYFDFSKIFLIVINSILYGSLFILNSLELFVRQPRAKLGIDYVAFYGNLLASAIWISLVIIALLFLIFLSIRGIRIGRVFLAGLIIAVLYFVLNGLYPLILENYILKPNELMLQKSFIKHRIDATRKAFEINFTPIYYPVYDNVESGFEVVTRSLRIWDIEPYKKVIEQMQTFKAYFNFSDVDVDVYPIQEGEKTNLTQVMIAIRELDAMKLPIDAQNWDNLHLRYTHGYGVVVSPSHLVDKDGVPVFWKEGIDKGNTNSPFYLDFPQIYFGEIMSNYIITHTKAEEFEYTTSTNRVTFKYDLKKGVKLGNFLLRALYSIVLKEKNILLSRYLTKDSRIIYRRNILDRLNHIFPYLKYDSDIYPVVNQGRILWIVDAYTVSDRFPIAERFDTTWGRINYIRNSVKATVDAYSGEVKFYLVDKEDPLVNAYDALFPGVFEKDVPIFIKNHFHYPYNLLKVQAYVLCRYHVDDEDSFYNGDDLWEIPKQFYGYEITNFEPYYMLSCFETNQTGRLTNCSFRFSVVEPFAPKGRENLSAWITGYYSDGLKLSIYYPPGSIAYGPMQINARINQDDRLSSLFTLWGQKGSKIFKGNIKFILLNDDVLYIVPILLESEDTGIPQLVKLVGVYKGSVYIGDNYTDLLSAFMGKKE